MILRVLIGLMIYLFLCSCTPGNDHLLRSNESQAQDPQAQLAPPDQQAPDRPSLVEAIREVGIAPTPPGVESEVWSKLKAELIRVLETRQSAQAVAQPAVFAVDNKHTSFTPYGKKNHVGDLRIIGSGPYTFTWTYRNSGDYDLNGATSISDLTPIGLNFGKTSDDPMWPRYSLVDGDGNGEVNIADVTPIGQNFNGTLIGYRVYATDDLSGEWTYIGKATVDINLRKNTNRPFFKVSLDTLDHKYYCLWPYDDSDAEGDWSNTSFPGIVNPGGITGVEKLW